MEIVLVICVTVVLAIFGFSILGILLRLFGTVVTGVFKLVKIVLFLGLLIIGVVAIFMGVAFPFTPMAINAPHPRTIADTIAFWAFPILLLILPGILMTKIGWSGLFSKGEKISRPYSPSTRAPSYASDYGRDDDDRRQSLDEWNKKQEAKQEKHDREMEKYWKEKDAEYEAEKERKAEAWRQEEQAKDDWAREKQEQWEQNQRDREEYTRQENEKWEQNRREMEEYSRQEREKWQNND